MKKLEEMTAYEFIVASVVEEIKKSSISNGINHTKNL